MNIKRNRKKTTHTGSTFDCFLEEEGIRQEVEAVAIRRVQAWQTEKHLQGKKETTESLLQAGQPRRTS